MLQIPKPTYAQYLSFLRSKNVPAEDLQVHAKWLRYYLDFCARYVVVLDNAERLRLFQEKLREKRQNDEQCRQAGYAVSLYHAMQGAMTRKDVTPEESPPENVSRQKPVDWQRFSQFNQAGYQEKSDSPEWDVVIGKLADEIKVRHYSRKTLRTYAHWSRQFQRFLKNKPPAELTTADVKEYLTFLAVKCNVAASTQNQAFSSG